jgi:hypothetical protein
LTILENNTITIMYIRMVRGGFIMKNSRIYKMIESSKSLDDEDLVFNEILYLYKKEGITILEHYKMFEDTKKLFEYGKNINEENGNCVVVPSTNEFTGISMGQRDAFLIAFLAGYKSGKYTFDDTIKPLDSETENHVRHEEFKLLSDEYKNLSKKIEKNVVKVINKQHKEYEGMSK